MGSSLNLIIFPSFLFLITAQAYHARPHSSTAENAPGHDGGQEQEEQGEGEIADLPGLDQQGDLRHGHAQREEAEQKVRKREGKPVDARRAQGLIDEPLGQLPNDADRRQGDE